ncbi:hypothetical protein BOX15_Mlig005403g1 [Macrostomum lignano]|uniref:Transmembrane protein 164 n=2 Tax=Macrostomum lignano TaxID=282301 RepID=A0A1I8H9E2_9PLAT|nr:hypothetical protein BOX15_Mlig011837g1 [Macrostomum lignano]PAA86817.1 hypothetical protein BOX15_Mlig025544g1 [Macrostomum lignano]PAA92391.1 hypothetical protein BOX15_Mlig005403g1 [Macrostomum lignano]
MHSFFGWTYSGINFSVDGAGGIECHQYLSLQQKIAETIPCLALAAFQLSLAWKFIHLPPVSMATAQQQPSQIDLKILGILHALVFGIEIGFKLSTNSIIWLLNPCHVITIIQIVLLLMPPCRCTTGLFRLMIHLLNGPLLALLLPVVNTRMLNGEVFVYYAQHVLILALPLFLIRRGFKDGVFTTEPMLDFSWVILAQAVQSIYHFVVLQPISCMTLVNLDNIMCPAISDPFRGLHYRQWAVFHQTLLVTIFGKCLTSVYRSIVWSIDCRSSVVAESQTADAEAKDLSPGSINGHAKEQ